MKKYLLALLLLAVFVVPAFSFELNVISVDQLFNILLRRGDKVLVVDVRDFADFMNGSIHGSKNMPANFIPAKYASLPKNKEIVVVAKDDASAQSAIESFRKLGVRNQISTVSGGMYAWEEKYPVDLSISQSEVREISAGELDAMIKDIKPYTLLDVRSKTDFKSGHIPTAVSMPFEEVANRIGEIDPDQMIVTYSSDPSAAYGVAKFLCDKGYSSVRMLNGGISSWVKNGKHIYN